MPRLESGVRNQETKGSVGGVCTQQLSATLLSPFSFSHSVNHFQHTPRATDICHLNHHRVADFANVADLFVKKSDPELDPAQFLSQRWIENI